MKFSRSLWLMLCWSAAVLAHHGNTEYDLGTVVKYEGTIVEFTWRNPHILAKLATKTPAGEPITLEIEGASPSVLRTGGYSSQSLVQGEHVVAVVSPSRVNPKQSAYGYEFIKDDGTSIPLVSARMRLQQTSQITKNMFGTWVPTAESFSRFTRSLGSWGLTDKGRDIRSKFTIAASGQVRCIPVSAPMLMMYPVVMVFEKAADHVSIKTEWLGAERTIYTDGRAHPAAQQRFPQGHSVGHWEGDVLVVDTTNFSDQETGGIPSGSGKHLVEKFTLADNGKGMSYSYVLQDPEFLTGDITGGAEMNYRPDLQLNAVECDQELAKHFIR
ncbi:MAG TPA: DUF6152 family protein [Candidatus Acidoferrum sp.]|nr:DUF6152 family protein [Candidatus Acidoferrum sp.]